MSRVLALPNSDGLASLRDLGIFVGRVAVPLILLLPLGCGSNASSGSSGTDDARPSLFEMGLGGGRDKQDSVEGAIAFACAELGVDPWCFRNVASSSIEVLL